MNVSQDLSIFELMLNASLVVKLVMLLLIVVSLMSWYWIFRKGFAIRDARTRTDQFERDFWSGAIDDRAGGAAAGGERADGKGAGAERTGGGGLCRENNGLAGLGDDDRLRHRRDRKSVV